MPTPDVRDDADAWRDAVHEYADRCARILKGQDLDFCGAVAGELIIGVILMMPAGEQGGYTALWIEQLRHVLREAMQ